MYICLSVCLSASLPVCLPAFLSACLPACLLVCLSVCLSVCLQGSSYSCSPTVIGHVVVSGHVPLAVVEIFESKAQLVKK